MNVPAPWEFALLALAAFRTFKLVADDTILDRPRAWTVKRLGGYWEAFLLCPWCAGFWITVAWWAAWQAWGHWTLVAAAPFGLSAAVGLAGVGSDRLAD